MINPELFQLLPTDIIINNIIPYTYQRQCPYHLRDIRSFRSHFSLVENFYYIYYNETVLLNDLEYHFFKSEHIYSMTNNYYNTYRQRVIANYYYTNITSLHVLAENLPINNRHNIPSKIKCLWGLMTPKERIYFINKYVL